VKINFTSKVMRKFIIIGISVAIAYLLLIMIVPISIVFDLEGRDADSIPIGIYNKTNKDIIAIVFAAPLGPEPYLNKAKTQKYELLPGDSKLLWYYLGKRKKVGDIAVFVAVWIVKDNDKSETLKTPPYLMKSFINPESVFLENDGYGKNLDVIVE